MSRLTLEFILSRPDLLNDLLHEFALHDGIVARASEGSPPTLLVEMDDAPNVVWEVRATIGMFDDGATEVPQTVADDQR